MRKIELNPQDQKMLEQRCLANIRSCNEKIRKNTATYNDYENAPDRLRNLYTREEYKSCFIDAWREIRRGLVYRLRDIRQGVIYE